MLQVEVNLIGSVIYFSPPTNNSFADTSLQEFMDHWLNDILGRSKLISPIITGEVSLINLW